MSVAPAKSVPLSPPELVRAKDQNRIPKLRRSEHLIVPRVDHGDLAEAKVTVTEMKNGVRLSLDKDNDGIGVKHVDLTLAEAGALSVTLSRVRRKVADRSEWAP